MDSKPEPILSVNGDTLKMSTVKTILKSHEMFETEGIPMLVEQARQEGYKDALEAVRIDIGWLVNPGQGEYVTLTKEEMIVQIWGILKRLDNTKGGEK